MDRRFFISAGGIALTAASPLAWADDNKKKYRTSSERTPRPTPTPTPAPNPTPVTAKSRVIVIGGGMAGATVAKYLRLWGNGIAVTLIERETSYVSNIMSSLVLSGQRTMSSLTYNYSKLMSAYGVTVVKGDVTEIDTVGLKVKLANGTILAADRIVIAPGIDFEDVPGLGTSTRMPHAWKAGPQTTLLASQLAALPKDGKVLLTIPKAPFRCPPGPYERACLVGDWLKAKKPGSTLTVLDANADILAEADNFHKAFAMHNITYVPNAEIVNVDPVSSVMKVNILDTTPLTGGSTKVYEGNVVNLIPRQKAGKLIAAAGLNNSADGRFANVNHLTYESTKAPKIHIIGDAAATTQPKAGHIANQEAKVCADAIVRAFANLQPDPAPVTNSACYSTITMTQASWLTAVYQYDPTTAKMAVAAVPGVAASVGWNTENFKDMNTWFNALMADSFA
jgi:sulfide dehydrogenase [flavocytochrome c] flavoprotein subunit